MSPLRTLLVDDHPVVREGLRAMLAGDEVTVVAEAGTCADALRAIESHTIDLVLLDMQLPDGEGTTVLTALRARPTQPAVLVLSMHDDPARVRRAMEAGARGWLLKGASRNELLAAMRAAVEGRTTLDPSLTPDPGEALTAVEQRVLSRMAEGRTNREIADDLGWSVATVKKYAQRVFEKLDARDRTEAVATAVRRRIV